MSDPDRNETSNPPPNDAYGVVMKIPDWAASMEIKFRPKEKPPEPEPLIPRGVGFWGQHEGLIQQAIDLGLAQWGRTITTYSEVYERLERPYMIPLYGGGSKGWMRLGSGARPTVTNWGAAKERLQSEYCKWVHVGDEEVFTDEHLKIIEAVWEVRPDVLIVMGPIPWSLSLDSLKHADIVYSYANFTRPTRHVLGPTFHMAAMAMIGKPLIMSVGPFDNAGDKTGVPHPAEFDKALQVCRCFAGYGQWGLPDLLKKAASPGDPDADYAAGISRNILSRFIEAGTPKRRKRLFIRLGALDDWRVNKWAARVAWRAGYSPVFAAPESDVVSHTTINQMWHDHCNVEEYAASVHGKLREFLEIYSKFCDFGRWTPEYAAALDVAEEIFGARLREALAGEAG